MFKEQKATVLFLENYNSIANVVVNQGGSGSGKTYAIMQVLYYKACEKNNQVITVVGQDIPNLKSGVLRDALKIFNSSSALKGLIKNYNKTDRIFEFHNGSAKHPRANDQPRKFITVYYFFGPYPLSISIILP